MKEIINDDFYYWQEEANIPLSHKIRSKLKGKLNDKKTDEDHEAKAKPTGQGWKNRRHRDSKKASTGSKLPRSRVRT